MAVKIWKIACVQHQRIGEIFVAEGVVRGVMKEQEKKMLIDVTCENWLVQDCKLSYSSYL